MAEKQKIGDDITLSRGNEQYDTTQSESESGRNQSSAHYCSSQTLTKENRKIRNNNDKTVVHQLENIIEPVCV